MFIGTCEGGVHTYHVHLPDPDRIVATGELAARDLDWKNRYSVDEMVRTGWEARRAATPGH